MDDINIATTRDKLPEYISIISANRCARIRISDIEIIEQEGRKIHVVTAENDFCFYGSMNSIAVNLVDRAFFRIMKSLIINFDHVLEITGTHISFVSGQSIPLGRNSINKTRRAYKRYLMKYPPYSLWEPLTSLSLSVGEDNHEAQGNSKNANSINIL